MLALTGAHRSGKTTLAKSVAEKLGVEYLDMQVTSVFDELGISPKDDMDFATRLKVQERILDHMQAKYLVRLGRPFIADRSPYDVIMYTMADVRRDSIPVALRDAVASHIGRAYRITDECLKGVLKINPIYGQPETLGKAQSCPFYTNHVDMLLNSIIRQPLRTIIADTGTMDLEGRIADLVQFYNHIVPPAPEPKIWTPST